LGLENVWFEFAAATPGVVFWEKYGDPAKELKRVSEGRKHKVFFKDVVEEKNGIVAQGFTDQILLTYGTGPAPGQAEPLSTFPTKEVAGERVLSGAPLAFDFSSDLSEQKLEVTNNSDTPVVVVPQFLNGAATGVVLQRWRLIMGGRPSVYMSLKPGESGELEIFRKAHDFPAGSSANDTIRIHVAKFDETTDIPPGKTMEKSMRNIGDIPVWKRAVVSFEAVHSAAVENPRKARQSLPVVEEEMRSLFSEQMSDAPAEMEMSDVHPVGSGSEFPGALMGTGGETSEDSLKLYEEDWLDEFAGLLFSDSE
jgi:hypothetical protein